MDAKEFQEAAKAVIEDAANYQQNVSSFRVISDVKPGYLASLLPTSAPMQPEPFSAIRTDVHDKIMPGMTHWMSPHFMAFFPCLGSYPALLADMYSMAMNGAYFNWICSPAATELEMIVIDWLAQALGLPECFTARGSTRGGGVLHGSASEAVLTVMVAAREKFLASRTGHLPDGEEKEEERWRLKSRMVAMGSTGTHSSTRKAAQILGVRFDAVPVYEEDGFALRAEHLADRLTKLKAKGLEPFFLTATLGTTDFCAVDDFDGIADVLDQTAPDVFVHVDAAYAGSALLLPEYQHLAASLSRFHSFTFNPHKWLLTGYDCSATFVRSRADLINALSINPPYLRNRNQASDDGLVTDYRDWQISLGRRFRSLKLWFVLRSHGILGLRDHLQSGIRLAESLERRLRTRPDLFTVLTPAHFGLVTLRAAGRDEEEINARTEAVYNGIFDAGEYYLTSTVFGGKTAIRVCTGVKSMREEHIEGVFRALVREAEKAFLGADPPLFTEVPAEILPSAKDKDSMPISHELLYARKAVRAR